MCMRQEWWHAVEYLWLPNLHQHSNITSVRWRCRGCVPLTWPSCMLRVSVLRSVASLTATLSKSQQEAASLQLLSSSQASTAAANIRKLQAEVTQLQQENMQLAMQQSPAATPLKLGVQPDNAQQHQGSPKRKTGMLSNKQPPSSLVGTSLIAAGTAADTPCKVSAVPPFQQALRHVSHPRCGLTSILVPCDFAAQ